MIAKDVNTQYGNFFEPGIMSVPSSSKSAGSIAPRDLSSLVSLIKAGITRKSVDDLLGVTGFSLHDIAGFMHVNERTLRNYNSKDVLGPEASERAIEIALFFEKGKEIFGSLDAFKNYVSSPQIALGQKSPKEFLDTSFGIRFLMDELGRIQYGIVS